MIPDSELYIRVEEALNQIRPYLIADGGDVTLEEISPDLCVKIKLHGACVSCNMSHFTMKAGIEETIMRSVPEIKSVIPCN